MDATWELHFFAPYSPAELNSLLSELKDLKSEFRELRMDYALEGNEVLVMVGDVEVLRRVMRLPESPYKMTVQFQEELHSGRTQGTLVLVSEGDVDHSETDFIWSPGAQ